MTQSLLDSVAPGNSAPWQAYLNDRFIQLDENGTARTKAELLREIQPLPAGLVRSPVAGSPASPTAARAKASSGG